MIDYFDIAGRVLRSYKVTQDYEMPWVYRKDNPQGRYLHDDWPWPFSKIPRMKTSFRVPLPYRLVKARGPVQARLFPWQEGYPISPDAEFVPAAQGLPYTRMVVGYDPVLPVGCAGLFSAFIEGEWRPCYYTSSSMLLGRRLHTNRGLKPDMTWGDFMTNLEGSLTWTKINNP